MTDSLLETTDSVLETTDSLLETTDSLLETTDSLLETTDLLLETTDSLLEMTDLLLETTDSGYWKQLTPATEIDCFHEILEPDISDIDMRINNNGYLYLKKPPTLL